MIDDAARSPLPVCPVDTHCALIGGGWDVQVAVEDDGRQFGGLHGVVLVLAEEGSSVLVLYAVGVAVVVMSGSRDVVRLAPVVAVKAVVC
jgi:hypothetical protein